MNHLDNAVKSLQGSLRDIDSQLTALGRERVRVERALSTLTGNRPVARITGVQTRRPALDMPSRAEALRRREMVALFLAEHEPGYDFTASDFLEQTGEPLTLVRAYRHLLIKMAGEDGNGFRVMRPGLGRRPAVYRINAEEQE